MSDSAVTGASEPTPGVEVPVRGGISGTVVRVRLGVVLGFVALIVAFALLAVVISGEHLWWGVPLAVVALAVSGYAAFSGYLRRDPLRPVHRGQHGQRGRRRVHLSKIAWTAGIVSEIALLLTVALCVALIVRAVG